MEEAKPKPKRIRENKIEQYLVKRVKEMGGVTRKVRWIGRKNAPDRLVMMPREWWDAKGWYGDALWVELKAPRKKANACQEREHKIMRKLGQKVFVLDTIEKVEEWVSVV